MALSSNNFGVPMGGGKPGSSYSATFYMIPFKDISSVFLIHWNSSKFSLGPSSLDTPFVGFCGFHSLTLCLDIM